MTYSIALVQANNIEGNNIKLPLALGVLWQQAMTSSANQSKWSLTDIIYTDTIEPLTIEKLAKSHMIAFSCYVWNFEYHMKIAAEVKAINPDCFIVVGGPMIYEEYVDFWKKWGYCIDFAIVGEGDDSFLKLLEQWPTFDNKEIPGAWTPDWYSGQAPRPQNLKDLPSPYLSGFYDEIVATAHAQGRSIEAILQTNRGCPYHCTFCEEGKDYKNKLIFFDKQRVLDEIEWFGINQVELINIADDNWGIVEQDIEFIEALCKTKLKYGYPQVLNASFAKNAPSRVLAIARVDHDYQTNLIKGITFAYQSNHAKTLDSIKRFNLVPDKQWKLIQELKKINTPTYVEMIWPLPHETYQTFLKGIDDTINLGLHTWLQVYMLGLSQSTQLYDDYASSYQLAGADADLNMAPAFATALSNKWIDQTEVIQGLEFYTWLAVLYYFGFARPAAEWLMQNQNQSVTTTVDKFLLFASTHSKLKSQVHDIKQHWGQVVNNQPLTNIGIFDQPTNSWQAYTHLASWLQQDFDQFLNVQQEFLLQTVDADVTEQLLTQTQKRVVQLKNSKFDNLFEFAQHYYFYKRKSGISYAQGL